MGKDIKEFKEFKEFEEFRSPRSTALGCGYIEGRRTLSSCYFLLPESLNSF